MVGKSLVNTFVKIAWLSLILSALMIVSGIVLCFRGSGVVGTNVVKMGDRFEMTSSSVGLVMSALGVFLFFIFSFVMDRIDKTLRYWDKKERSELEAPLLMFSSVQKQVGFLRRFDVIGRFVRRNRR
jgi:hypothetical protein